MSLMQGLEPNEGVHTSGVGRALEEGLIYVSQIVRKLFEPNLLIIHRYMVRIRGR